MDDILMPKDTWVLVCDGARAQILRNDGDAARLDLHPVSVFSEPHAPARDLGSDRPGRVVQSVGSARSATEETDWHEQAEVDFLKKIAHELDAAVVSHKVQKLVVVAPPRAMGLLRTIFTDGVKAVIKGEVTKDLSKLSPHEIAEHLSH